jgi:hypothetical protein
MTFLQLKEVQAQRSVVKANRLARMTKEERLMATATHNMLASDMIDNTIHTSNPKLVITDSKEEIKIWGYVMTHYNLKAGLRRFGDRGKTVEIEEMTQLYIMDMWKVMDSSDLSHEEWMQALSSLLFLKKKLL